MAVINFSANLKNESILRKNRYCESDPNRLYWNSEENQIIFHVPNPDKINWEVLDIPDEITLKRHASITFAARTGNESSLKAYQFYWEEKSGRLRINSR